MLFSPSKLSRPFRKTGDRNLVLAAAVAAVLAFAPGKPASAEDIAACDQFNWPVKREQALFGSKDLQHVASGATLASLPDRGIALELQPYDSVPYALPPGRQPKIANSSGGFVVVSNVPKAGQYQITASAEGWIDVIQDGKPLVSAAHSGRRDCPDVRKSVRFDLQSGAVTIQVSGVDFKARQARDSACGVSQPVSILSESNEWQRLRKCLARAFGCRPGVQQSG